MKENIDKEELGEFTDMLWIMKINYNIITDREQAKFLIKKGYRRADEVRKETAKEILQYLYDKIGNVAISDSALIEQLAYHYDVELD